MNEGALSEIVKALGLAIFQRNARGCLRRVGHAPKWLLALWPQAAKPRGMLPLDTSPFLDNFLVDAAAGWQTGRNRRVSSGPWIERDANGAEHCLQAVAFTCSGRATLLIESPHVAYKERMGLVQKAHELSLAYEKLQRAEQALAEEKLLLEQRVCERTSELSQANAALKQEIATRQRFAQRLQVMHELDKAILAAQSPEAIAEAALRRLHRLLPCAQASLVALDPDPQGATVLASMLAGKITGRHGWRLSAAQLQKSRALRSGRLHQVRNQPNLFAQSPNGAGGGERIWPLIVDVPLIAKGTLVGILNLAARMPEQFTAEHSQIAQEIAAQLAVALREARLFDEVKSGREQLRSLSSKLVEVQETERRFLARELHDEIGQVLTSLKLALQIAGREGARPVDANLNVAVGMVDDLMGRIRQLSLDLRPQMLDDLGLMPALDWLFQRHFKQIGLRVLFKHTPLKQRLPAQQETALFRIVQEALTNVARHARVHEVTVRLWQDSQNQTLGVQVHDTGVGFDVPKVLGARASSGLAGIRERAALLGGQFTLDSSPGAGTRLTVELPAARTDPDRPGLNNDRQ